jgi:hypothetical protein
MLLLVIGALTLVAVAVGVVARASTVHDSDSKPATVVTPASATPDPDTDYLRQVCGSLPPIEDPSFCLGRDPSFSPSQLVIPGYED